MFFDLNGQPRMVRVPDRSAAVQAALRPRAEAGNPAHVGAPMPGAVSTIAARPGQKIRPGDLLLTIEAMKMETALHAEREATIRAIHVQAGSQIDARDLLIELEIES